MWWWMAIAMAASPWKDMDADIRVEKVVRATPEEVTATWSNFDTLAPLFDEDCLDRWAVGVPSKGEGARGRVSYKPSWMNRRLNVVVKKLVPGKKVLLDHEGNRGFFTKITVRPVEGGTAVVVHTLLNPPPWPFRKAYHVDVKPAWAACYIDALARMDGGSP